MRSLAFIFVFCTTFVHAQFNNMLLVKAAAVVEQIVRDNTTVLLLNMNGTNAAQNNTFIDQSPNNFTITRNGNTTQGSFSPFSAPNGYWSNYFQNGAYLTTPSNTALDFGTGNFTIEAWAYVESNVNQNGQGRALISNPAGGVTTLYISSDGNNVMGFWNGSLLVSASFTPSQWNHFAVTRSGSTLRMFVNGVLSQSVSHTGAVSFSNSLIGSQTATAGNFLGYISNLRLLKGTALYTSNFTLPTTPLGNITNTSLLTCSSIRFIDNSTNNFTFTISGTPSIAKFSPFNREAAYSTSSNGGSGYFDGTGDFLSTSSTITLNGDFCAEAWYYRTSSPTGYSIIFGGVTDSGADNTQFVVRNNGAVELILSATVVISPTGTAAIQGQWNHIAWVRSGNTLSIFVNGIRQATVSAITSNTARVGRIGTLSPYTTQYLPAGYISSARVVVGSSVYNPSSTTITVPTEPLSAITNTRLLVNFTNGAIFDESATSAVETLGNAQLSTAQNKFGGASTLYDGTGDYLSIPASPNLNFGAQNFTVEGFFYSTNLTNYRSIISTRSGDGVDNIRWSLHTFGTTLETNCYSSTNTAILNASHQTTLSANTWNHFALVRNGTELALYLNGVKASTTGTVASTVEIGGANIPITIGAAPGAYNSTGGFFIGYIDGIRITKGVARYTANFTPPTSQFN